MRRFVVLLLRGYKWAISPALPPSCRYVPTCSEYAMEAVERYGVLRGAWMAGARVLRCHPFARGGYDPVRLDGEVNGLCCHSGSSEQHVASRVCAVPISQRPV